MARGQMVMGFGLLGYGLCNHTGEQCGGTMSTKKAYTL